MKNPIYTIQDEPNGLKSLNYTNKWTYKSIKIIYDPEKGEADFQSAVQKFFKEYDKQVLDKVRPDAYIHQKIG